MQIDRQNITAGILAGGQGSRLGGIDKGWYELDRRPLIEHTLDRVAPQCAQVLISANRSLARYRTLGWPVVADDGHARAYHGPLAGIACLLRTAETPWVLIVPVDTPLLPLDLVDRLAASMTSETSLAVARCEARIQPLHALMRRDVRADLDAVMADGVRAVNAWQARLERAVVDWPDCAAFGNLNRPGDACGLRGEPPP